MSRIVVAEKISPSGIDRLRGDGHEIVDAVGWPRDRLLAALADAEVLLVRSGTKVDAELLAAAPRLAIVGRAGVGVDNVDMPAATRRGVLVINSPTGNVVSAVEHTFALLFALLRRVVPAAASLAAGKWDRTAFVGVELEGKVVGIVGLGQVGSRVASRAQAFGASVVGYDPFLPPEKAREIGVELVALDALLARADVVTLHATATDSARKMIDARALSAMKPGAFLVNVARGSLVDLDAVDAALASGSLGGAALDVFDPEPPDPAHPIFRRANVVATPHLGASTQEAQERVAAQTVDAVREALAGAAYVPAVNLPFRKLSDPGGAAAWMDLAERAARFVRGIADGLVREIAVDAWNLPAEFLRPAALAAVKGALSGASPETVNLVNALSAARDRGIAIAETSHEEKGDYANLLRVTASIDGRRRSVEGTIFGRGDARIVSIDGRPIEFRPRGVAIYVENDDVPGVVGLIGTILGGAGINIAEFALSRREGGEGAVSVLSVDTPPPPDAVAALERARPVRSVRVVEW
ncbi:MAG TPA: phosphoglycerate dehydrogenase [Thermoanaerobaculia bacterium]|nr:phosphoglycerate dehydrogenase [Thermoanaerobaculia bacterium]